MKTRKEWFHGRRFVTEVFDDGGGGGGSFEPVVIDIGDIYSMGSGEEWPFTGTFPSDPTGKLIMVKYKYNINPGTAIVTNAFKADRNGPSSTPIPFIMFTIARNDMGTDYVYKFMYDVTNNKLYTL